MASSREELKQAAKEHIENFATFGFGSLPRGFVRALEEGDASGSVKEVMTGLVGTAVIVSGQVKVPAGPVTQWINDRVDQAIDKGEVKNQEAVQALITTLYEGFVTYIKQIQQNQEAKLTPAFKALLNPEKGILSTIKKTLKNAEKLGDDTEKKREFILLTGVVSLLPDRQIKLYELIKPLEKFHEKVRTFQSFSELEMKQFQQNLRDLISKIDKYSAEKAKYKLTDADIQKLSELKQKYEEALEKQLELEDKLKRQAELEIARKEIIGKEAQESFMHGYILGYKKGCADEFKIKSSDDYDVIQAYKAAVQAKAIEESKSVKSHPGAFQMAWEAGYLRAMKEISERREAKVSSQSFLAKKTPTGSGSGPGQIEQDKSGRTPL